MGGNENIVQLPLEVPPWDQPSEQSGRKVGRVSFCPTGELEAESAGPSRSPVGWHSALAEGSRDCSL